MRLPHVFAMVTLSKQHAQWSLSSLQYAIIIGGIHWYCVYLILNTSSISAR